MKIFKGRYKREFTPTKEYPKVESTIKLYEPTEKKPTPDPTADSAENPLLPTITEVAEPKK